MASRKGRKLTEEITYGIDRIGRLTVHKYLPFNSSDLEGASLGVALMQVDAKNVILLQEKRPERFHAILADSVNLPSSIFEIWYEITFRTSPMLQAGLMALFRKRIQELVEEMHEMSKRSEKEEFYGSGLTIPRPTAD